MLKPAALALVACSLALAAAQARAQAQAVTLNGMLGGKALLIIDGNRPQALAPGDTRLGVRVVSTSGDTALVEIDGRRYSLRVGEAPASVGASADARPGGSKIVIPADSNGHFFSMAQINGKSMQVLVDTGATVVSLGAPEAQRIGLDYKAGQMVRLDTANGNTVGWRVKLNSVRVGDVTLSDVDAIVTPLAMPYVLLGNSFLTRFQMTRANDQMVLERRY